MVLKINIRYDPTNDAETYIFNKNGKRLEWILKVNKIDNLKTKEVESKNFYKSYQFKQGLFSKQNKGLGLITGEPGAGKSSLLRYFKESLNPNLNNVTFRV